VFIRDFGVAVFGPESDFRDGFFQCAPQMWREESACFGVVFPDGGRIVSREHLQYCQNHGGGIAAQSACEWKMENQVGGHDGGSVISGLVGSGGRKLLEPRDSAAAAEHWYRFAFGYCVDDF
jgi:hypothetical protein